MTAKLKTREFFSNLKNNIINIKTNQTVLVCMLLSIIYLTSGYFKWIEIAVSVCALVIMAIIPLQNAFCIFMFLHSFTLSNIGYDSCFMVTQIGICLIMLVKYILGIKKGKFKFYKKIVICIASFISISVLISVFHPFYRGAWLYFAYFAMFYFIFAMRHEFSITQGMNYMFGGLLTSCALALTSLIFPLFQYEVFAGGRFRAFINNTNYLYMRAMFVLAYYMYRYLNKKLSNISFSIIYILLAVITLSTLSKTGIAMLALFTLIFFILFLKQDFKKRIKFVGVIFLAVLGVALLCNNLILIVWKRFETSFKSENFLNSLLTGRDLIWKLYLQAIFKNPFTALFGHGMLTEQIFIASIFGPTETHNFYIFLLYRFGIIGTIALGYIVYLFIKELGYGKPKFIAYLPLIFILIESLCDNTFKCYNISYFLCAIMVLFAELKENKKIVETIETKQTTSTDNEIKEIKN